MPAAFQILGESEGFFQRHNPERHHRLLANGQTYSHFDVDLSPGGEQVAALSTAVDTNVDTGVMTDTVAKSYFSSAIGGTATPGTQSITLAYGDTTQDLGGGQAVCFTKAPSRWQIMWLCQMFTKR